MFHGKPASWYGSPKGEMMCGNVGNPKPCSRGAVTASGAIFDPAVPSLAIAIPRGLRLKIRLIYVKTVDSACTAVWLTDKKNERYMEKQPWDMSRGLKKLLNSKHGDNLYICEETV